LKFKKKEKEKGTKSSCNFEAISNANYCSPENERFGAWIIQDLPTISFP
jgi:hypothetical protein